MLVEISWISILFGAFGLGVLRLTWDTIKFFISRRDSRKINEKKFENERYELEILFNDLISDVIKIQELLEAFILQNNAARALLLKLENGGGIPQLGTVQHMSVLGEAIHPSHRYPNGTIHPVKQDFQDYVIDSVYQKIMLNMVTNGVFDSKTSELEEGLLKNIYDINHIKQTVFIPVTQVPSIGSKSFQGFMIYMSIEFTEERQIDEFMQTNYIILQAKIKSIFHEFYIKRISKF